MPTLRPKAQARARTRGDGPRCVLAMLGAKAPRIKREDRRSADVRQRELFMTEVQA